MRIHTRASANHIVVHFVHYYIVMVVCCLFFFYYSFRGYKITNNVARRLQRGVFSVGKIYWPIFMIMFIILKIFYILIAIHQFSCPLRNRPVWIAIYNQNLAASNFPYNSMNFHACSSPTVWRD